MSDYRINRPAIPQPMEREIRQRCGFGCVICGEPIYQYHHKKAWENVHEHVAADITLLCDKHHAHVTKGLLSAEQVERADQNPRNRNVGHSNPLLLQFEGTAPIVRMGGNTFSPIGGTRVLAPLVIDDFPIIGFRLVDGGLLLTLNVFDEFNEPVLVINDNALVYRTDR